MSQKEVDRAFVPEKVKASCRTFWHIQKKEAGDYPASDILKKWNSTAN